jgi:hypothetical protein
MPRGFKECVRLRPKSSPGEAPVAPERSTSGSRPGEEAIVRFLEQDDDIFWCMMHEVPVEGRSFGKNVPVSTRRRTELPAPAASAISIAASRATST